MNMNKNTLLLALLAVIATSSSCEAFISSQGGWKNRPAIPELEQRIEQFLESDSKTTTEKWDFFRGINQSLKFVSLPKLGKTSSVKIQPGDIIWDKSASSQGSAQNNPFAFAPLDDVVMGGVSSSTFVDGKWTGTVSESNSGGFIGIRSTPFPSPLDMSECKGVEFKIRGGKNKVFKAVLRDSTDFNGICWASTFGEQFRISDGLSVKIPFESMIPTIFARTVPDQTLNKSNVVGFQLVYSKFLYDGELNPKFELGDFDLEVLEIKAY